MNIPDNDKESRVGTGTYGRRFYDLRGWPTTPDPTPLPQYPSSTPQDNSAYMKLLRDYTHYPSDYYHLLPNDLSDGPQLCYMDIGPANATTRILDVEDSSTSPPGNHQDHQEGVGAPASGPSRFRLALDGRDPSSTESLTPPLESPYFRALLFASASHLQLPPSQHRGTELDTSRMLTPISDDHPFIPTRTFSWMGSHSSEFGNHEVFSATMGVRGPTQGSHTVITSLGNTTTSPSQDPLLHIYSADHLPNSTSNDYSPLNTHSTRDEVAPSDTRLGRQGIQSATTVALTQPPSHVSAHRNSRNYWCHLCDTGFAQKQGLNRHNKDQHLQQNACPYCGDFEWSLGRYYLFMTHLVKKHPGAALPRM